MLTPSANDIAPPRADLGPDTFGADLATNARRATARLPIERGTRVSWACKPLARAPSERAGSPSQRLLAVLFAVRQDRCHCALRWCRVDAASTSGHGAALGPSLIHLLHAVAYQTARHGTHRHGPPRVRRPAR